MVLGPWNLGTEIEYGEWSIYRKVSLVFKIVHKVYCCVLVILEINIVN